MGNENLLDYLIPLSGKFNSVSAEIAPTSPLFGFTPFPYDLTGEALEKTYSIIIPNSTIIGFHLDDGIPWNAALTDSIFPAKLQNEWLSSVNRNTNKKPIYLGLAPLEKDRVHLVHDIQVNDTGDWSDYALDDIKVKTAYLNYARRAVKQFKPDFLNLGIEAGELALRKPSQWESFSKLYDFVRTSLKKEYPALKIGISFGLQSLMKPEVAKLVSSVVENSDYLCLSFYPNMSTFGEKFGAPALPAGINSWLEPLHWVRTYTKKPLAICETGYSSQPVTVKSFDLHFPGNQTDQARYVHDLIDIAKKDQYLFVIWFLVVDYDRMLVKLADKSDVNNMWKNIGFFDKDLNPKPAWSDWKSIFQTNNYIKLNELEQPPMKTVGSVLPKPLDVLISTENSVKAQQNGTLPFVLNFQNESEPLLCNSLDQSFIDADTNSSLSKTKTMRWSINYVKGEWNWCYKKINAGLLSGATKLKLLIRSDIEGQIFIKLEESNKEAYYIVDSIGKQWQTIENKLSDFKLEDATRKNGTLDLSNIDYIIIADPGNKNGASGHKTIWIKEIEIE